MITHYSAISIRNIVISIRLANRTRIIQSTLRCIRIKYKIFTRIETFGCTIWYTSCSYYAVKVIIKTTTNIRRTITIKLNPTITRKANNASRTTITTLNKILIIMDYYYFYSDLFYRGLQVDQGHQKPQHLHFPQYLQYHRCYKRL